MDETERDAAELLAPLRDAGPIPGPAPGSSVSIERAVRAGRRRKQVWTAAGSAAVVLVVVLTVGVLPGLLRGIDTGRIDTAGRPAPDAFNPMWQVVQVGSAGGYAPVGYETGRYRQVVELGDEKPDEGATGSGTITVYAQGRVPGQLGPDWEPLGDRAPDVYGRPAFWLPAPRSGGDGVELAWRWSADAWAFVHISGTFPDLRDRAHRVAQSVTTDGEEQPVRLPFTLPRPDGLTVLGTRTGADGGSVLFGTSVEEGATLEVGARLGAEPGPGEQPIADIGGHPATADGSRVTVREVGAGFSVVAEVEPADAVAQFGGIERVAAVAGSVQLVDAPGDRAGWVPDPVR
ncbi:hypothetical protein [Pseudonocardia sp. TRM90224]|uniref:hypothetical protein n=1 Tax=Pseudonocardia sp. TRM90224 TaxID=2812678 RepID=UPI001E5A58C1|nr:hypothetical protein [Pseudonocardia sp. TRM90224]